MKDPSLVVLTGAGISAESGLSTFRAQGGLWEEHRIEDVATPEAFDRQPALVYNFYNKRRQQLQSNSVQPNSAHFSLAKLEAQWPGPFLLITQNVDNLHERAGSRNLIHMHGELLKARCLNDGQIFSWEGDLNEESFCPHCQKQGQLRPHIVWFGEIPMELEQIQRALTNCDIFLSIGTSGSVYPAAGFVMEARRNQCQFCVEMNKDTSEIAQHFDEKLYGPATEIVPPFVEKLLKGYTSD